MIKRALTQTPFLMFSFLLLSGCHVGDDVPASRGGPPPAAEPGPSVEAPAGPQEHPTADEPLVLDFLNSVELLPGVWGGGQPTREQLRAAAKAGVRMVVNLRTLSEEGAWDESEFVEELGMSFVHIPVAGASGLTRENAALLMALTDDALNHPVLVHCASGRRVAALIERGQAG